MSEWFYVETLGLGQISFIHKVTLRNGMWVLYPEKPRATPYNLRLVVKPEIAKVEEEIELYQREERLKKVEGVEVIDKRYPWIVIKGHRVRIPDGRYLVRLTEDGNILNIELLPAPEPQRRPALKLVFYQYAGKATGMGGYRGVSDAIPEPLFRARSSSGSGRHWSEILVWLVSKDELPIKLLITNISNRGNLRDELVLIDENGVKTTSRYERIREIRRGLWWSLDEWRDNLLGKTMKVLITEWHEARKTSASTRHEIECLSSDGGCKEFFYSTVHPDKTHWVEAYIVKGPLRIRSVRITNNGNVEKEEVIIQ